MLEVHVLAIDLAKRSFQLCGADRGGAVLFNRSVSRSKLQQILREQPPCIVEVEACATNDYWGRMAIACGHEVRLIPPIYGQERRTSGTGRRVPRSPMFRRATHAIDQRASGSSGEVRVGRREGPRESEVALDMMKDESIDVLEAVRDVVQLFLDQIEAITPRIDDLAIRLRKATKENDEMRRLCTVPGVGPVTASAVLAFAPDLRAISSGRNFAAWLGLAPRQHSTGGKTRLGALSKMEQNDIRRLLIVGAMSRIRWIVRKGILADNWLGRILGRKPRRVAAVALANKMARVIWAMMIREQNFRIA